MQIDQHEGRKRAVISGVRPEIESGRFPIKRVVGEDVVVEADVFADGHDELACLLLHRNDSEPDWHETPMAPLVNDRWRGAFAVSALGGYRYTLMAWVDPFRTWRRDLGKRIAAGQDISIDLRIGAGLLAEAAQRAGGREGEQLRAAALTLEGGVDAAARQATALSPQIAELMDRHAARRFATRYERELEVTVDRQRARYSSWYEMFPRSCAGEPGRHGTFADCEARLPYIAAMGFDVLYLPPIHPIGPTHRKGPNNAPTASPDDHGSPWAIGAAEGGHKAIHPQLGTLAEFRSLVERARQYGIELALDIAYQCAPDHPYVREHPAWFRHRPDGTIQYAENPPKKYQDIYPLDFESDDWQGLWEELRSVVRYWMDQGVRIFRVDNPHTKALPFWEWMIGNIRREAPDVIFLSEAFTRPKVMYRLAKAGFTQSYTYFAWRNTKAELTQYFTELTQSEVTEYFRPNLWPNTPDILTEALQTGGRPAFMSRLVLAATLGASYGIYGPAFELCEGRPREPGSEEYLNSEKYEIRHWDLARPDSLKEFIGRVNRIRRDNPALQSDRSLRFHDISNDELICYSKHTEDLANIVVTAVNLSPVHRHWAWVELPIESFGLEPGQTYQMHDLLGGGRYLWSGSRNYVELDPHACPAQVFLLRRRVRSEQDFEYFL